MGDLAATGLQATLSHVACNRVAYCKPAFSDWHSVVSLKVRLLHQNFSEAVCVLMVSMSLMTWRTSTGLMKFSSNFRKASFKKATLFNK